jgi:23S rRNA pseudouridine1911/1915/1917 synthase
VSDDAMACGSRTVVVLHEHAGVLAVHKPAGLATQAVRGIDSMECRVREMLVGRGHDGYLGVPHRLDRCVSGVMLFATTRRAARKLARQFERREITKRYLAIVQAPGSGLLPKAGDLWVNHVVKLAGQARGWIAAADDPAAREARTRVVAVSRHHAGVVLELEPETGRMHQLRIQTACRGMPIAGDLLYGSTERRAGRETGPAWHMRHGVVETHSAASMSQQSEGGRDGGSPHHGPAEDGLRDLPEGTPRGEASSSGAIALAAISIEFVDPGEPGNPGSQVRRCIEVQPAWEAACRPLSVVKKPVIAFPN